MGLSPCFISTFATSDERSFAARGLEARESGAGSKFPFKMVGQLIDAVEMDRTLKWVAAQRCMYPKNYLSETDFSKECHAHGTICRY